MMQSFDSLLEMMDAFPDEQTCVDHLRAIRWKNGAYCPHCGSTKIYHFADRRTHKCGDCRQRFSIKVGTIFQDTKLPLRKWYMAIWLITSHKKGIASTQIARDLKITQKSGWFVLHRLRHAARTNSFNAPLDGEVEVDETFVGGKEKNKHASKRKGVRGTAGKDIVVGAAQRGGRVVAKVITNTDGKTLKGFVRANVSTSVTLLATDEHSGYTGLSADYMHKFVSHAAGEYAKGDTHTNTIEGYWSQLKRQIIGIHHWVSGKHLDRYVAESSWRYNLRGAGEGNRVNQMLSESGGRLTYKALIA